MNPIMLDRPMCPHIPADNETFFTVRKFIASAMTLSCLKAEFWNLPECDSQGEPTDLDLESRWLQLYFLDCLEFALATDAEPDSLFEDFGEEKRGIELGKESTSEWTRIEWEFAGRDEHGAWCFVLNCTDADDSVIWLDDAAIDDRSAVAPLIEAARQVISV